MNKPTTNRRSQPPAKAAKKIRPGLGEQQNNITGAAIDLFSERGVNAVSVSDICKKAGISRDTYYRCFTDKETLINKLYQTAVNDHIEHVLNGWDLDYSNEAWLAQACDTTIDAILQQHKVAQFLFVESALPNSYAQQVIQHAYNKTAKRMQRWCTEKHGETLSKELLIALLVAAQWLVHDAINKGMSKRQVNQAKAATKQLFFATFASLEHDKEGN
ncbi:TetR/AcrR family transcriptional regulator [Oceanicoccus sp. KOV_DT_Chl]|uniref:TetR/AcrR family transcriptional regulator n=1 Tax=Oceanicoccus sp. KOV_DT_Chl TaxID=1904639 RepID=UPI000C7C94DD|nr:TetR/AcrR family transcriptional regulator [Oceanicoccus sp. KOV_DT_Chl]